LGLEIKWRKTKIQSITDLTTLPTSALDSGNPVDIVESCLGSEIHTTGSSETQVRCRLGLAKTLVEVNAGVLDSSVKLIETF